MNKSICEKYNVKVGDIFSGSWGYSMTIPEFYQVVKVTKQSVRVRKIGTKNVLGDGRCGHAEAIPDFFVDDCFHKSGDFLCRVIEWGDNPAIHVSEPDVYCHRTENLVSHYDYND